MWGLTRTGTTEMTFGTQQKGATEKELEKSGQAQTSNAGFTQTSERLLLTSSCWGTSRSDLIRSSGKLSSEDRRTGVSAKDWSLVVSGEGPPWGIWFGVDNKPSKKGR